MDNKYLKTDFEGLVKDSFSGAVLNVDNAKLDAYKKQKNAMNMNMRNNERIEKVEKDLQEIKAMLSQLIQRNN
jgi:hypothetical protein